MKNSATFRIPEICKNSSILLIVLLTQLFAVLVSLMTFQSQFLATLSYTSFYLHWVVLISAVLLCSIKSKLNSLRNMTSVILTFACVFLCFTCIEVVSQLILNKFDIRGFDYVRFGRHSGVACIIIFIICRFFALLELVEQRNKSEMIMKMRALQLRINPHFLFNTLNTIAELTNVSPKKAEEAVIGLGLLFRVGLENENGFHSLDKELALCDRFIMLEKLRLEDKLDFSLKLEVKNKELVFVPKLLIQPLLENSLIHGVMTDGRVNLGVEIKETKSIVSFHISNECGANAAKGMGVALDNIKERLFLLFDDKFKFRSSIRDGYYSVFMSFPKWSEQETLGYSDSH